MTKNNLIFELVDIPKDLSVINFYASWYPACSAMNETFKELSIQFPNLLYFQIEAEEYPELSEKFEIDSVPTFIVVKDGKLVKRLEGADAPKLTETVQFYSNLQNSSFLVDSNQDSQKIELKGLVHSHPVMIFMKGDPQEPKCGFSSKAIKLLKELNVTFGSFDILSDDQVRQGLKEFSNWPTFPQIYVNGEFIGGLDILEELIKTGEFQNIVPKEESLNEYLQQLITKSNVMLFMKGSPKEPKCGFSRQIVSLLNDNDIKYEAFDILSDDQVRQGLKEFSNWPTFPQLYVNGELVGGLDIVKETITDIKNMI